MRGLRAGALALMLLLPLTAPGDRIVFRDGRSVEGRVISENDQKVVVEASGMRMEFRRSTVAEVIRDEPWTNGILEAEAALRGGQPARGFDALFRAISEGAPDDEVERVMMSQHATISSNIRSSNATRRGEISFALNRLFRGTRMTSECYFRVSQHFYQLEEFTAAAEALRFLSVEDLEEDQLKRIYALELMRFVVRRQLKRGEFEEALQMLETMRRLAGESDDGSLPLALLAAAGNARDQGRFDHAIRILAGDLYPRYPEIARNRLVYTVDVMKQRVLQSRDYMTAIEAIGPLADVFPIQHAAALNFFMMLEVQKALDNGDPPRAMELVETMDEQVRSPELVRLYNIAYHDDRVAGLGDSDPLALVELARWCMQQDLQDQAMAIFQRTRQNPNLRELSTDLLVTLRRDRDTRLLEEAQRAYDMGQYGEVARITAAIIEDPGVQSALDKEARQLRKLAEDTLKRDREATPYRAEVLFQNAERAYFAGNLEEAYHLAKVIVQSYGETPAARRAMDLLPGILRSMELAFLEGKRFRLAQVDFERDRKNLQRFDKLDEEVSELLNALGETH